MSIPKIQCIEDLSPANTEILTQLLSLSPGEQPTPEWLNGQATCLTNFPAILLRPSSVFKRAAMALPLTPQGAQLCKTHKLLNGQLIRRIFLQVSAECTTRIARLEVHTRLPKNILAFVTRIHSINSLWMSPNLFRVAFKFMPFDKRFDRVSSGCEACILASIGGNIQVLSDLRTSMLGRKKKRAPVARLLKIVDAWIDWSGKADEIRAESDELSREVRNYRRQLQNARRLKRQKLAEAIDEEVHSSDEHIDMIKHYLGMGRDDDYGENNHSDENNIEGSIVDYYDQRLSTVDLASMPDAEAIHPVFRDSTVFDPPTGTFRKRNPEPLNHDRSDTTHLKPAPLKTHCISAYPESTYSRVGGSIPWGINPSPHERASSEEQAQEYRDLVGRPKRNDSGNMEIDRKIPTGRPVTIWPEWI